MKFKLKANGKPIEVNHSTLNIMFRIKEGDPGALLIMARNGELEISIEHYHDHKGFVRMVEVREGRFLCPVCATEISLEEVVKVGKVPA